MMYTGPFEVLKQVIKVSYELVLPPTLSAMNSMFYISILKKDVPDGSHRLQHMELHIQHGLSYEEEITRILDRSVKTLHKKEMTLVKVAWSQ